MQIVVVGGESRPWPYGRRYLSKISQEAKVRLQESARPAEKQATRWETACQGQDKIIMKATNINMIYSKKDRR